MFDTGIQITKVYGGSFVLDVDKLHARAAQFDL